MAKRSYNILILGAGQIGSFLYEVLRSYGHNVQVVDTKPRPSRIHIEDYICSDITDLTFNRRNMYDAIVSCLPHELTTYAWLIAQQFSINYFDFTEDIDSNHKTISKHAWAKAHHFALVPGCGLAPGYIEILGAHLVRRFEAEEGKNTIISVGMYVGGNPQKVTPPSNYAFTWSVDGLVNQYLNDSLILVNGEVRVVPSLSGKEVYLHDQEAFFTSGGHGQFYAFAAKHNIPKVSYRTIRHKGHHAYLLGILSEIPTATYRESFRDRLRREIAVTQLDEVQAKVTVTAYISGKQTVRQYSDFYTQARKQMRIKAHEVLGAHRTAMQIATVGSAAQVIDFVLKNSHKKKYRGFVPQTSLPKSVFKDKINFPELIIT